MSAFDWSENRHSREQFALRACMPSANGSVTAASTASMALNGAISPRAFFFTCSRTAARIGGVGSRRCRASPLRSRVLRGGPPFATTSRAKATAPGSRSPSTILSRMPASQRVGGPDRFAAGAHLRGLGDAGQTRQPLRAACAGDEPELHLRLADLRARRRPRGSGRPSPSPARRRTRCRGWRRPPAWGSPRARTVADRESASSGFLPDVSLPNSLMSAPPQKVRPPPIRTMPLMRDVRA